MLVNLFVVCASLGGTVLVGQLLVGVLGLGSGHGEAHGDGHGEAHGDPGAHELHGGHDGGHPSPWLGFLSLRTLATALCFFGLGGLAALHGGAGALAALLLGAGAGAAGGALTATLQRAVLRLRADGTLRLEEAVGRSATVYLAIPGGRSGAGKVTLQLQGRTVECEAVTSQAALPTGSRVLVVDIVGPGKVAVEPDILPPGDAAEPDAEDRDTNAAVPPAHRSSR